MSDQFLGEIRMVAFNFPPTGWAYCDGQLLPIDQNTALFALLGTNYGGNAQTTFALPNLQGAAPLGQGQGPGLSLYAVGQKGGEAAVTLTVSELPSHTHGVSAAAAPGTSAEPGGLVWAEPAAARGETMYTQGSTGLAAMAPDALTQTGGGQAHDNMPPFLTLNFVIALQGIFPARS